MFYYLCRHTAYHYIAGGDTLRHYRAGCDDYMVGYTHAGQNDTTCTDPHVIADDDGVVFEVLGIIRDIVVL